MIMLPILMYHQVEEIPIGTRHVGNYVLPEQFDAQLTAISRWGYVPITLEDWLDFRAGRRKPPHRPIALTFDDGYLSNHDIAWPLLRRHGMTATVFLVTDLIGGTNPSNVDERQVPRLGPAEIGAMQAGGILFGSHTCTHGSLIDMQPTEAFLELTRSRTILMALLGRPVVSLAYPYLLTHITSKIPLCERLLGKQATKQRCSAAGGPIRGGRTHEHSCVLEWMRTQRWRRWVTC